MTESEEGKKKRNKAGQRLASFNRTLKCFVLGKLQGGEGTLITIVSKTRRDERGRRRKEVGPVVTTFGHTTSVVRPRDRLLLAVCSGCY